MNVYEGVSVVLLALSTLIHVQDAQEDNTQKLTGPESFITNGTRKLNLTCGTEVSEDVAYTWFFPPGNGPRVCDSQKPINVCTFVPRVDDDTQDVICVATARNGSQLFRETYALNLTYPPESSAAISIEPPQTEPLTQGDVITCTVSGGKPRVTNVSFHCQHPDHADQDDDVSGDGRTVSSSITVDTSQATEVNMTCTCSAHWDPEPELYDNITNAEFMLEYKSIVTNFTVNGNTSKTVAESEMVMFRCQGAGRPSPTLILRKHGTDTAIPSGSDSEKGLLHHIYSAQCEDLGNYTCEANNNFDIPNSRTVQLFVRGVPRVADASFHPADLCNVTQVGLTVTVVGYPTPNISVYSLGNDTVPENAFIKRCVRDNTTEHLVHCVVTPDNVSTSGCGVYDILIWNEHGNISLSAVDQHKPQPEDKEQLSVGEIVGIAVGIAVGVFIVIGTVCFAVRKWNKRKQKTHCYGHYENTNMENTSTARVQKVATIQPHLRGSQAPNTNDQPHSGQTQPYSAYGLEPGYACPADMIQRPSTSCGSNATKQDTKAETNPLDPGYATADDIGMSTDAQRAAVSYNLRNNSLKSRSAEQYFDVTLQPAEPANKPQDNGVGDYNVLGGQGATSGPDPTYSHINKVNKNQ